MGRCPRYGDRVVTLHLIKEDIDREMMRLLATGLMGRVAKSFTQYLLSVTMLLHGEVSGFRYLRRF